MHRSLPSCDCGLSKAGDGGPGGPQNVSPTTTWDTIIFSTFDPCQEGVFAASRFGSFAEHESALWSGFESWGRQRSSWPLSDGGFLAGYGSTAKGSSCQRTTERCLPSARHQV